MRSPCDDTGVTARILAAPDKFRGSATAAEVAGAIAAAVGPRVVVDATPMSDGGEGLLDVFAGGRRRTATVTGPLGEPVEAEWLHLGDVAVIEMARASGLALVGGPERNDPLASTTTGTGELIALAVRSGAREVVVGAGGSATTDGGLGCVKVLSPQVRYREVDITVAVDVRTTFVDAARTFAPQKGATQAQVELLTRRLERLADEYERQFGVDVRAMPGAGAAGGLAGGLAAAVGASVVPGFELVADLVDLDGRIEGADLVVTGEGLLDRTSFDGKVVGGVISMAVAAGVPVLVVAGAVDPDLDQEMVDGVTVVSLSSRFGEDRSWDDTLRCIGDAVRQHIGGTAK